MKLIKCPKCETWCLPADDERWCGEHGPIPLPGKEATVYLSELRRNPKMVRMMLPEKEAKE